MSVTCLHTTVRNTGLKSRYFGFLGPHGALLAPGQTMTVKGDLVQNVSRNARALASLEAALSSNLLEIITSPAQIVVDATTNAVKQLGLTNGAFAVADPCYGPYKTLLTGAFNAITTPTASPVASATVVFSAAVTGFTLANVTLTKDAVPVVLSAAVTTSDSITFVVPTLTGLTGTAGVYVLTIAAVPTIADVYNNALLTPITITWTHS